MSMENSAEQGGGRRNPDGFRGRQRSYAEFYTTDVKGFYQRIVLRLARDRPFRGANQLACAENNHNFGHTLDRLTDEPRQQPYIIGFAAAGAVEQKQPIGGEEGFDHQRVDCPCDNNTRQGDLIFIEEKAVNQAGERAAEGEAREKAACRGRDDVGQHVAQGADQHARNGAEHGACHGYRQKRAADFDGVAENRQGGVGEHAEHHAQRQQHGDDNHGLQLF